MPKPKEEYFNSEMEHFESLRNGINNPPSMSQQSNTASKASDTTADTNDMANLRQVIPGSQQVVGKGLSQLSEGSEDDDINDAMFSQQSNDSELSQEEREARRLKWKERSAAESNNPIENMRAAAWSKVEDAPTPNTNTNTNATANTISHANTNAKTDDNNANYTNTNREYRQLRTTSADLLKMIPMAIFILVPFMEFVLPIALYLFPGEFALPTALYLTTRY